MMRTGRSLIVVLLVLLSITARGQERRKFVPLRATSEPVAASPRFDAGIVPVDVRTSYGFEELNDEFEIAGDRRISAVDGIEKVLARRSPALTTKWSGFAPVPASSA